MESQTVARDRLRIVEGDITLLDVEGGGAPRSGPGRAGEQKVTRPPSPAISTGIYGFPLQDCSRDMLRVSLDFL